MINEVITIIYWLGDWNFINFQTSYSATGNKELKNIKSCNAAISTDSNDTKCDVFRQLPIVRLFQNRPRDGRHLAMLQPLERPLSDNMLLTKE